MKRVLAIDLGASSGRAILGIYEENCFRLEEVNRFSYEPIVIGEKIHWDIDLILTSIIDSIKLALKTGHVDSLAVDTWGVDYGLLDEAGQLIEPPVHYRDSRTKGMLEHVRKKITEIELFEMTGNQLMEINTLFQLKATALKEPEKLAKAKDLLMMPDLINYLLTGKKKTEKSIASTSQLMEPIEKKWNMNLIERLALPTHIFTHIVDEAATLGLTKKELGIPEIPVVHVCSHDTASAFVSATGNDDTFFVSCGTWSLIGVERENPVLNEKVRLYNITNESGISNSTRLLKNITGLWIIQQLKKEFAAQGKKYSYADFEKLSRSAKGFKYFIDTEDPRFLETGHMIKRIHDYLLETNQTIPTTDGELIRLVYENLAFKYKATFLEIMDVVNKPIHHITMVGGGTQSKILCEMVASASGLKVTTGPIEATALGNIGVQLLAQNCFASVDDMRKWIVNLNDLSVYEPQDISEWNKQFQIYKTFIRR